MFKSLLKSVPNALKLRQEVFCVNRIFAPDEHSGKSTNYRGKNTGGLKEVRPLPDRALP